MEEFEIYILDKNFVSVCLVDKFESFIWTERYREAGDFELYLFASSDALVYATHGNYLWLEGTDRMMIIETTEITTDVENGNHLRITGRSLESILSRRIIWHQVTVSGGIQAVIKQLITSEIISPSLSARAISNFIFVDSTNSYIASCEIEEVQYLGDNLYDVIVDICSVFDVGFKVTYNFNTGKFEFRLYYGEDRSYDQDTNPWVVFSPEFDNIITSDYIESSAAYKNVNLIAGEEPDSESGNARKFVYVDDDSVYISGLERREMFTDGSSNKQKYKDEHDQEIELTDSEYIAVLKEKALAEIYKKENKRSKSFDGEMNTTRGFMYDVDFLLGDIIQMQNEYGLGSPARVVEMIRSQDTNGIQMYPTFESMNNGG